MSYIFLSLIAISGVCQPVVQPTDSFTCNLVIYKPSSVLLPILDSLIARCNTRASNPRFVKPQCYFMATRYSNNTIHCILYPSSDIPTNEDSTRMTGVISYGGTTFYCFGLLTVPLGTEKETVNAKITMGISRKEIPTILYDYTSISQTLELTINGVRYLITF